MGFKIVLLGSESMPGLKQLTGVKLTGISAQSLKTQ